MRRVATAAVMAIALLWPGAASAADGRYALAGGCYALRSVALGRAVAQDLGPFRMQATALGRYLFVGRRGDFLAVDAGRVVTASKPGPDGDWIVEDAGPDRFTAKPAFTGGMALAAGGDGGLLLTDAASAGAAGKFGFAPASGCAEFPESQLNASGTPSTGATPYSEVRGLLDMHVHGMFFEALGGAVHCGRPWSPYGITVALGPCADPTPAPNVVEGVDTSQPQRVVNDPVGWPTFKDWPAHDATLHEGFYWRWLEREWRAGLRVYVNLLVDNHTLCVVAPVKRYGCNEMDAIRREIKDVYALQDYIDAQSGGPGKGWYRVVTDPFQARRVMNEGKLAVVLGIETSQLFDCTVFNETPGCDRAQIDRELNEMYAAGVRSLQLINKFDNALAGVTGDAGTTGVIVNAGNKLETGNYWQLAHCTGPPEESDKEQLTLPGVARDGVPGAALQALLPRGALPVYPAPPHCNVRGLTPLGEYVVQRIMQRGMIVDPDHLDVVSRKRVLDLLEAARYSGVVSSHSWSTTDAYPRIYRLGGVVTPYAGDSTTFVQEWRQLRDKHDPRFYFGFGYGADMNGVAEQGGPRNGPNPVSYPFKSFDGAVTLDRLHTGQRVWDINSDGVANYGLYPDWIEDLRKLAGEQIIADMSHGPEAYLQMWERAVGIMPDTCRSARLRFTRDSLGQLRLSVPAEELLRGAGQPDRRIVRTWRYCVKGGSRRASVTAAFTPLGTVGLIASTAPYHRALGIGSGAPVAALAQRARPFGRGLFVAGAGAGARFVYGVRGGRVRFVAVASRQAATSPRRLRGYLRLAGVA